jgi:4a-hydroxytetrahydrobiopterin dehydratase
MKTDTPLEERVCVPCRGGVPPLSSDVATRLLGQLRGDWQINAAGHLAVRYVVSNFVDAMQMANAIAKIAEAEQHHPDLTVRWGACEVEIWTHKINGLTESDFVLAAKIERAWARSGIAKSGQSK